MVLNWFLVLQMRILLPKRETAHAAGYDLKVAVRTVIAPGEIVLVPTGVKAYMQPTEVLYLYDRSSNPRKKGLVLINSVGVIDGDYYGNPGNEGHIFAQMKNITDQEVVLEVGERVVQAVFAPFLSQMEMRQTEFVLVGLDQAGH